MTRLIKFQWDMGDGALTGAFVVSESEWERIKDSIEQGLEVNFGDLFDDGGEMFGPLTYDNIKVVSEDQNFNAMFQRLGLEHGINPLHYSMATEMENTMMNSIATMSSKICW